MLLLIVLISVLASEASEFCGVDRMEAQEPRLFSEPVSPDLPELPSTERELSWESIRFVVDWSNISSLSKSLYSKYMQAALDYYSNSLKVHRLSHSFLYHPSYDQTFFIENFTSTDFWFKTISADLLIQMLETNDEDEGSFAYCQVCTVDPATHQPLTAVISFNVAHLAICTSTQLVMLFTHELTHALGFISNLFPYFLKPDGSLYDTTATVSATKRGKTVNMLATAKVVSQARSDFGCSSLEGVELEDFGGDDSIGSHWDSRVMYNELMNPQHIDVEPVYSSITFALLEDSGWYIPDYSYAHSIQWGFQRGCEFFDEKCIANSVPVFEEFCADDPEISYCSFNLFGYGPCFMENTEGIPEYEQYFVDPTLGGENYTDFCPVVFNAVDCSTGTLPQGDLGETFCEQCRCVEGTYSISGEDNSYHAACHRIYCGKDYATVHIGEFSVRCVRSGENVWVDGLKGTVKCPDINMICNVKACTDNCYGAKCTDGICASSRPHHDGIVDLL